jgi:hypothetical protein
MRYANVYADASGPSLATNDEVRRILGLQTRNLSSSYSIHIFIRLDVQNNSDLELFQFCRTSKNVPFPHCVSLQELPRRQAPSFKLQAPPQCDLNPSSPTPQASAVSTSPTSATSTFTLANPATTLTTLTILTTFTIHALGRWLVLLRCVIAPRPELEKVWLFEGRCLHQPALRPPTNLFSASPSRRWPCPTPCPPASPFQPRLSLAALPCCPNQLQHTIAVRHIQAVGKEAWRQRPPAAGEGAVCRNAEANSGWRPLPGPRRATHLPGGI